MMDESKSKGQPAKVRCMNNYHNLLSGERANITEETSWELSECVPSR